MNKRSAIAVAGGLTGALASGLAGYSVRVQHSVPPQAAGKPVVKTQVRTITVHRKPTAHVAPPAAPVQTVVIHRPPSIVPLARAPAASPVHRTGPSRAAGRESERDGNEDDGGGDD